MSTKLIAVCGTAAVAYYVWKRISSKLEAEEHPLPPVVAPTPAHRELLPRAMALLTDEAPVALFYDMAMLRERLCAIRRAFPASAMHAIACKANPLAGCLELAKEFGMGLEVASPGELEHALRLGFVPDRIQFDSPAKTRRDIRRALQLGVRVNADNLEELARIDDILTAEHGGGGRRGLGSCTSIIGVRVNPQYGEGKIAATGTIAATSKFGVPLMDQKQELMRCYERFAWLTAVHCHVGSQGCEMALLVKGAKSVLRLAEEINRLVGTAQVRVLDIGGGMPTDYGSDAAGEDEQACYVEALRKEVPQLFDESKYSLVTEYGRWVSAKCAICVSRVEYTKVAGGRRIAAIHCGADLFLRTCYQPRNWPHRVSAWTASGEFLDPAALASSGTALWDIVGPLCFRGDIVAPAARLPSTLTSGCGIAVHDAGAYTLAMFSKYNSRQAPPVYAVSGGGSAISKLCEGETIDDALRMWQAPASVAVADK